MTPQMKAVGDGVVGAVKAFVQRQTHPLEGRIAATEARLAALESRPVPKYLGVWETGHSYCEMNFVTHAGSVWHCNAPTTSRPGEDSNWTLAVKHGRDLR